MKNVYCKDCVHFNLDIYNKSWGYIKNCNHPKNKQKFTKNTWFENHVRDVKIWLADEMNAYNTCQLYEGKEG